MKTPWQPLSAPGVTGRFLAVRTWDGDISLAMCEMRRGTIECVNGLGIFDPADILALAGALPEVQELVVAAKNVLHEYEHILWSVYSPSNKRCNALHAAINKIEATE